MVNEPVSALFLVLKVMSVKISNDPFDAKRGKSQD
jgi:hypothetical protein